MNIHVYPNTHIRNRHLYHNLNRISFLRLYHQLKVHHRMNFPFSQVHCHHKYQYVSCQSLKLPDFMGYVLIEWENYHRTVCMRIARIITFYTCIWQQLCIQPTNCNEQAISVPTATKTRLDNYFIIYSSNGLETIFYIDYFPVKPYVHSI